MSSINTPSAYHESISDKDKKFDAANFDVKIVLDAGEKLKVVSQELQVYKENFTQNLLEDPKIQTPQSRLIKATNILKLDKAKGIVLDVIATLKGIDLPNGFLDTILFRNNQSKRSTILEDFEKNIKNESDAQRLISLLDQFLDINKQLVLESNKLTDNNKTVVVRGKDSRQNTKNTIIDKSKQVESAQNVLKGPVEAIEWQSIVFPESIAILEVKMNDALIEMNQKQKVLYEQIDCITDQEKLNAKLKFEKIQFEQLLKSNELELKNLANPINQEKIKANGNQQNQTLLENKSVELNKKITEKSESIKNENEKLVLLKNELPGFEQAYNSSKKSFDDANNALKLEKLKIVGGHRDVLKEKLDDLIASNKGYLDEDQTTVRRLNTELTKIQSDINELLQKQSKNSADFTPEDENLLKTNQLDRDKKVIDKVTTINSWMDRYVKSIIAMEQKYFNENKVNDEVRSPLENKLGVISNEIQLIDKKILDVKGKITGIDDQMMLKNEKAAKENRKSTPLHIGEISMLEEEAIGYEKQQNYFETRKKELTPQKEELELQISQVNSTRDALSQGILYLTEKANNLLIHVNYKIVDSNLGFTISEKTKILGNLAALSTQIQTYDTKVLELDQKINKETDRVKKNELRLDLAKYSTDQLKSLAEMMGKQISTLSTKEDNLTGQRGKISAQASSSRVVLEKTSKSLDIKRIDASKSTDFGPKIIKPSIEVLDGTKIPQNLVIEQQEEKK